MTKLLIEISDAQDARLLLDFARRLNANILSVEASEDEAAFWEAAAFGSLERAYGIEEPDYELAQVKEPNPAYQTEPKP